MVIGSAVGLTSLYSTVKIKDTTHSQRYCFLRYHSSFCGFNAIFRRVHQKLHQLQQVATSPTRPRSSKKNLAKVTTRFAVFDAEKTPTFETGMDERGCSCHQSSWFHWSYPQFAGNLVWSPAGGWVWTGFHDGHGCERFG